MRPDSQRKAGRSQIQACPEQAEPAAEMGQSALEYGVKPHVNTELGGVILGSLGYDLSAFAALSRAVSP